MESGTRAATALQRIRDAAAGQRCAGAARDKAIIAASRIGLSRQDVADAAGLSRARVQQIVGGALGVQHPHSDTTLHEAMQAILLKDAGRDGWMHYADIAERIAKADLYRRKDGNHPPAGQVRARAAKYPGMFEVSSDGTGLIRLHCR